MRPSCLFRIATLAPALLLASGYAIADQMPDPETWYRTDYAPLWTGSPGENIERIASFYADEIVTHENDGAITRDSRQIWLVDAMEGWFAEGWLEAEMTALKMHVINDSTVTFTARWLERYSGGETEISCGWYLADAVDGRWMFTEYADVDCREQGFE